jgi:5-methylcytosine-specific restriction endonuclease McrA
MEGQMNKTCSACGRMYPATPDCFYRDSRGVDGFRKSCKECDKKAMRTWVESNPDRIRERNRRSHAKHRPYADLVPHTLTFDKYTEICAAFAKRCAYCGRDGRMEMDHVIPMSAGGGTTPDNVVPACISCNRSKHNTPMKEWYQQQSFYSEEQLSHIQSVLSGDNV